MDTPVSPANKSLYQVDNWRISMRRTNVNVKIVFSNELNVFDDERDFANINNNQFVQSNTVSEQQ